MRMRIATLCLLIVLPTGCASPSGAPSGRYPAVDLAVLGEKTAPALMARLADEWPHLKSAEFRTDDGVILGTVLAGGPVEVRKAVRGYMVTVGIGDAQPLRCTVQEGVLGLSAFARALTDAYLASYDAHELKYAYAGTHGSLPYLVVHGQYIDRGREGTSRRTGFLKLVVAGRAELTVACFHDQFGYRETVERVALSLVDQLRWTRTKPLQPLVRRSVYALRKDGQAAGSREVVIRADEEDFRRSWVRTAFLAVRGPQELYARDVVEIYDSDPDGRVITQTYQAREGGKTLVELSLEEKPMTDYEVSGQINEKPAEGRFSAPEGLPDLLLSASYRLQEKTFTRFVPELSTDAPISSLVEQADRSYRVKVGDRVIIGKLDEAGEWVSGTWSNGYSFQRTALER